MRLSHTFRTVLVSLSAVGLSACAYTGGTGYYDDYGYSDGYGGGYCDGYGSYDAYYDCDYRGGYANIGYGGGYYDDYYYPGYGIFIYNRGGQRYRWQDHHRRYWAQQRYHWYARNRGHHRGDGYRDGRYRDQRDWNRDDRRDRRERRRDRRDRRGDAGYIDNGAGQSGAVIGTPRRDRRGNPANIGSGRRGGAIATPPARRTAPASAGIQQTAPAPRATQRTAPPETRSVPARAGRSPEVNENIRPE